MADLLTDYVDLYRGPLYKYKSLDDKAFDHTMEILRDHRIFVPKPTQLNDPLECKPEMVVGNLGDPAYKASVEAWVRRCVRHRPQQPTEQEIQQELLQLTPDKLAELAALSELEYHSAIDAQYRILSMATAYDNAHLWNAYANNYTGACIQMHLTPWINAYHVKYTDVVPLLDLVDDASFAALDMTGLRKRLKWEVEGEARIILREPAIDDDPPLVDQKLRFGPEKIKAVVFGYRIDRDKEGELRRVLRGRGVPLYKAEGGIPFKRFKLHRLGHS